ncbi:MAG: hypothetical protein MHMPM18_000704 [Marteilia pararefringens]
MLSPRSAFRHKSLVKLLSANALVIQLPSALYSVLHLSNERYFDAAAFTSFSFLIGASALLYKPRSVSWASFIGFRKFLLFWLINCWAFRLSHQCRQRLQQRSDNRDSRFDGIRDDKLRFFGAWLMQVLWISAVVSPSLLFLANAPTISKSGTDSLIAGCYTMVMGYGIEMMADLQKDRFKSIPKNNGKFIDFGIWKFIEFPNYLGELLFWSGASIICYPTLCVIGRWAKCLGFLSPLYTYFQLTFVSGVNLQRRIAENRWGDDEEYWKYRQRVGMYWPRLSIVLEGLKKIF